VRLHPGALDVTDVERLDALGIALVVLFFLGQAVGLAMADDAREARSSPELVEALLAAIFGRSEIERGMVHAEGCLAREAFAHDLDVGFVREELAERVDGLVTYLLAILVV